MKLPEIQRTTAQTAQSMSPSQAAAPHLAKAEMLGKAANVALDINEMIDQNQVNKEMAWTKDALNNFENWMATQREFDPEILEAMGIADQIDMGEGGMVPKHKVYSTALQKFTEDIKSAAGERIGSSRHRAIWLDEVNNMVAPMITSSIKKQEEMAIDEMKLEAADSYQIAFKARNYVSARAAIDRYPTFTPAQRQAKKDAITDLADASYEWDLQDDMTAAASTMDVEALDALALKHRDNEVVKGSPLTDAEHNVWASKFEAQASAIRSAIKVGKIQEKAEQKQRYDDGLNKYFQKYHKSPVELLANMPEDLELADIIKVENYAEKTAGGKTIKTDIPTWSMLHDMSVLKPEEFKNVKLLKYSTKLSTSDYQKLRDIKTTLLLADAGGSAIPEYQTNAQIYNEAFVPLGISSSGSQDKRSQHQMVGVFASALDAQERYRAENNKQPMTLSEKKKIINDIVMFEIQKKGNNFERVIPFDGENSEEVLNVLSILGRSGVPVSARSADAVEQLSNSGLDITADTIRAAELLRRHGKMVNETSIISAVQTIKAEQGK